MTTGQYGGIGSNVITRYGKSIITMPYKESPANKAGLKIGDEILKIDDIELKNKSANDVSKLMKGQAGTPVKLTVRRFGKDAPIIFSLIRENIKITNVPYYGMINDEVAYIHLSDFTSGASREVKSALIDLKTKGAKKLIFDLRDNPGGLLHEAVDICNIFLPKEASIVSTKGKVIEWNKTYTGNSLPIDTDIPLIILTSSRKCISVRNCCGCYAGL